MSQIFQFSFPINKFFDFLEKYCNKNKNQFVFSKDAFKRAKLDDYSTILRRSKKILFFFQIFLFRKRYDI